MNNRIIDFLKNQPALYAESDDAFWDDEHISKGMLAAHLNPECDSASRKREKNHSFRRLDYEGCR